ncbi:MAG: DUF6265 family protein [Bacteroidota bacterium]
MHRLLFCFLLIISSLTAYAQQQFPNTLKYNEAQGSPAASLEQLNWISGYWKGEAFGGTTEEVWTPALGGSMMCTFKAAVDGKIQFYELLTISEVDHTLILRLKHFDGELKGWEAKDETIDFKLVKMTKDHVYFDQFTFEKVGKKRMNLYVVFDEGNGEQEMKFEYKKYKL